MAWLPSLAATRSLSLSTHATLQVVHPSMTTGPARGAVSALTLFASKLLP